MTVNTGFFTNTSKARGGTITDSKKANTSFDTNLGKYFTTMSTIKRVEHITDNTQVAGCYILTGFGHI